MLDVDADLVAERDRKIGEHHARHPPWWRFFARRRWRQRLAALRAMDVSFMAAMLRRLYTAESVEDLARRSGPAERFMQVAKARRARQHAETNEAQDQLAAWVDLQNGIPLYYPARAKEPDDAD